MELKNRVCLWFVVFAKKTLLSVNTKIMLRFASIYKIVGREVRWGRSLKKKKRTIIFDREFRNNKWGSSSFLKSENGGNKNTSWTICQ